MSGLCVPLVVRIKSERDDRTITRDLRKLSYRSTVPGGFASASVALDRPLSLDPDEIGLYADLYVYDGRSGATVWQGRLEDPGRGASEAGEVWTLRAVGSAAHARDDTRPIIYTDRMLGRWFRADNVTPAGTDSVSPPPSGGDIGLLMALPNGTGLGTNSRVVREYRALREFGQKLARIDTEWDAGRTTADLRIQLVTRIASGASDVVVRDDAASTAGGGSSGEVVVTDWTNGNDLAEARLIWTGVPTTVADEDTWAVFQSLVVTAMRYAANGSEITSYTKAGVYAHEVVNDLLGRMLAKYDGANASVATNTYEIDQMAYPDAVTPERILADLMLVESDHYWAAWEDSPTNPGKARFEWRAWPTTVAYEASASDGYSAPGSAASLYNKVVVRWRDTDSRIRSTTRTQTVQALTDAGLTRTAAVDIGDELASEANANQVGDAFLAEHANAANAGTITIRRAIMDHSLGRKVQPWEIRPGKLIRVRDVKPRVDALNATDRDAVTVFRVQEVDYDAGSNTATLALDSKPRDIAAIVAANRTALERARRR